MTVNQRFEEIIKLKTFNNKSQFDKICGFGENYSRSVINGNNPTTGKLENILKAFPDISPNWLLNGDGDMLKGIEPKKELSLLEETIRLLREELERYRKREDFFMFNQSKYKGTRTLIMPFMELNGTEYQEVA